MFSKSQFYDVIFIITSIHTSRYDVMLFVLFIWFYTLLSSEDNAVVDRLVVHETVSPYR